MLSRAHRRIEKEEGNNDRQQGNKPIFVQFVNWRVAEEIKSKVIQLNAQKRTKVRGKSDIFEGVNNQKE